MPSTLPSSTPSQPKRRARNPHVPSIPRGVKRVIRDAWWLEVRYHWAPVGEPPLPPPDPVWEHMYGSVFTLEEGLRRLGAIRLSNTIDSDFRLRHMQTGEIIYGDIFA